MTITIFTSNQPRHLSLIKELSKISKTVYAVIEVTTIFPGKIKDFFNNSIVMNEYFEKVRNSENPGKLSLKDLYLYLFPDNHHVRTDF